MCPPYAWVLLLAALVASPARAWSNHSLPSYRAFENMPEVSNAPATVAESLDTFLRSEEYTVEALLASQEAWAAAHIEQFPAPPPALAFKADPARSDESRRRAFLHALRLAADSRFALYYQPDPWNPANGTALPYMQVATLPEPPGSDYHLLALKPGDTVSALTVLASASDEPDLGQDANLWEDNASDWGKLYGLGRQPYGNPTQAGASQMPLHTSFMHESPSVAMALPGIKRNLVLLRSQQFSTLSALAFRTGHAYWGWRFAGLSLHYLQELTHPFLSSWAAGESSLRILSARLMAACGMPGVEYRLLAQQYQRQTLLDQYLNGQLLRNAASHREGALEKALHNTERDKGYPEWSDRYLREVASAQSARLAPALAQVLAAALAAANAPEAMPPAGNSGATMPDLARSETPERQRLDANLAELMANFGAHSRNALRGILRASDPP